MEQINLPSGEDFEDYCLRTFECFLQGDLFPYSLKETYRLAFASWDEAVNELMENGVLRKHTDLPLPRGTRP